MRLISIEKDSSTADFARKATEWFNEHPHHYTYADGDPQRGELFAVRWSTISVLVFQIAEDFEPCIYPVFPFIKSDLQPLQPTP